MAGELSSFYRDFVTCKEKAGFLYTFFLICKEKEGFLYISGRVNGTKEKASRVSS